MLNTYYIVLYDRLNETFTFATEYTDDSIRNIIARHTTDTDVVINIIKID